jgi:hypothetical protein
MSKLTKFQILDGCMKMSGHMMYDSDWEKCMAFYLMKIKVNKLGDQFTLEDSVEVRLEAEKFQLEFDEYNAKKSTK